MLISSFIHNNSKLEISQVSLNIRMNKQTVVYSCHVTVFSNKKEQSTDSHNVNKSHKHAESKKPYGKDIHRIIPSTENSKTG